MLTEDLFADQNSCYQIDLADADICLYPCFINADEADYFFKELMRQIEWSEHTISIYGQQHKVPRLSAWYADNGKSYEYSGFKSQGLSWNPLLLQLKSLVETVCDKKFNSVLVNRYRNGSDGVGWHADDEKELGTNPLIASLSFGQQRNFQLKHRRNKTLRKNLLLEHGSLLIMQGETQHHWLHQIAKSAREMDERINLTFRIVK